jgi:selenide,water dikinase
VETTDIITPLVDDPVDFGRIAAANALSDVFAMGGRPVTAMNLVFFPVCTMPGEILRQILMGGLEKVREAGACLVGGHTVEDDELKYGLAVTGLVHPERIVRNSTPRPGDRLILTKPLGTGIISTALKGDMVSPGLLAEATSWMTTLNATASRLMVEAGASAATDVTGFGLLGHAVEMARGGAVTLRFRLADVPLLAGLSELVADGLVPAGCYRNRDYFARFLSGASPRSDHLLPLFDPQTSGGLLISLPPSSADRFLSMAAAERCFATPVGEVIPRGDSLVELL